MSSPVSIATLQTLDYFASLLSDAIHHLLDRASLPRIEVIFKSASRMYRRNNSNLHFDG